MTTFGLVHGAYHGAWCRQPLIDELERREQRHRTALITDRTWAAVSGSELHDRWRRFVPHRGIQWLSQSTASTGTVNGSVVADA
jgi:hypothetical protein